MKFIRNCILLVTILALLTLCGCASEATQAGKDNGAQNSPAAQGHRLANLPDFEPLDWANVTEAPAEDFTYEFLDRTDPVTGSPASTVRLTAYIGSDTIIKIPDMIEGCYVRNASPNLFRGNTEIHYVRLPAYLDMWLDEEILERFFEGCTSLLQVQMPENVLHVPNSLFAECTALRLVTFPGDTELSYSSIGNRVFQNCISLTEQILPDYFSSIGGEAFAGCVRLETVEAPGVIAVGQEAFSGCGQLKNLTLNGICSEIEGSAFDGCVSLEDVHTLVTESSDRAVLSVENGVIYSVGQDHPTRLVRVLETYDGQTVSLREDLEKIESASFRNCRIRELKIPASVTFIRRNAITACPNLKRITLEAGSQLTNSHEYAVTYCPELEVLDLSNAPADGYLNEDFYSDCPSLKEFLLPGKGDLLAAKTDSDTIQQAVETAFAPYAGQMEAAGFTYELSFRDDWMYQAILRTHKSQLTDSERELLNGLCIALLSVPETGLDPQLLENARGSMDSFVNIYGGDDQMAMENWLNGGILVTITNN